MACWPAVSVAVVAQEVMAPADCAVLMIVAALFLVVYTSPATQLPPPAGVAGFTWPIVIAALDAAGAASATAKDMTATARPRW
jgi:hypothetical protein